MTVNKKKLTSAMKHGSDARLVDMVVEALLQGNMGDRRIIIRRDDEVETKGSM